MNTESAPVTPAFWTEPERRVPRIALMGEFSAGKSTLANLMIGTNPLPVQVVATQLPPVWISHGSEPSVIVDLDGGETPCDLTSLQGLSPEDTAFIRFSCDADILEQCDLIDMPGISDPNMASTVWERILPFADAVIWCTPATQAWRQSEAAVWSGIDTKIRQNSILVVTRADKLLSEQDRNKVFKRIKAETEGLFSEVVMMSLTKAENVDEDEALWTESGADTFVNIFLETVARLQGQLGGDAFNTPDGLAPASASTPGQSAPHVVPKRPVARGSRPLETRDAEPETPDPASYMPKFS